MKHYRQILFILCGLLLLSLGMLAFMIYESGMKGREHCKQEAEASLKSVTELWANREFDKLGIPFSYSGGEPSVKSKRRRMVMAEGEFVVELDSVKETKRLLNLYMLSANIRVSFMLGTPSVESLNELWKEELKDIHSYCSGALRLRSELPGKKKGEIFTAGDSTLMTAAHELGVYYIDDMYFLELSAYLSIPSFWYLVDWGESSITTCLVWVLLCLCALILLRLSNRKDGYCDETDNQDDFVKCISEKEYQIGGILFDKETGILAYEDGSTGKCPLQPFKLLSAFIQAENHFLSNERIVEVCGWNPEDIGVNERRRVTISQLRKLLDSKKSRVNLKSGKNEEQEQGFYLVVVE